MSAISDPNRSDSKTPHRIAREGAIFNINGGSIFTGNGALMRFIVWPGSGCRTIGGHLCIHEPGVTFRPHIHPISEDCICTLSGYGEGFLVDKYVDVGPGDMIYAPAGVVHGTANARGHASDFIVTGYAGPPQLELYEWAGYFKHGEFDWDAIKEGLVAGGRRDLDIGDEVRLGEIPTWGEERAENKTPEQIRETGAIFNINGGLACTGFGPLTRFVVAPFTGARLISATVVVHQPGETFEPHVHPVADDANLVLKGKGQVYLGGRWSEVKAGDIVFAPPLVQHGTRNPSTNDGPLVVVSFACPPPLELYERAGILKDGRFVNV